MSMGLLENPNFCKGCIIVYSKFSDLLQSRGLRPADVSKGTGINQTVFSEWKKGKSTPKIDKLQKIAAYFDVPIEYFTDDAEVEEIKKLTPADDGKSKIYAKIDLLDKNGLLRLDGWLDGQIAQNSEDK